MKDVGVEISDAMIKGLMQRIDKVYIEAFNEALDNNRIAIAKFDRLTDDYLRGLSAEAKKLKREAFAREIRRTQAVIDNIAKELGNAGKLAADIIYQETISLYGLNYNYSAFNICRQAGVDIPFDIYDRNQIATLVKKGQSPFTKIAYNNLGNDRAVVARLQNQFISAALNGDSQPQLIRRIRQITGQNTAQAKRVAQTERNRVQSQGRFKGIEEADRMGVVMQKQWIARLVRTREMHALSHLEIVDYDKPFINGLMFPGDPNGDAGNVINCHCLIVPKVVSVSTKLQAARDKFNQAMSFEKFEKMRRAV